jgi:general secretion pathway protein B
MSYILEALKKAQAERQLGALPTIHAAPSQAGMPGIAGAPARTPLWLALSMPAMLVLLALLIWRQPWHSTAPAVAAAPSAVPVVAAASTPPAAPVPGAVSAPRAAPVLAASAPLATAPVPATRVPDARPSPALQAAGRPMPPEPAADGGVLNLRDLPEPIQRQIPPLALGGYIYSRNPADRLLLIDKVLRHEGEEVAPGLTLDKLEPKAAVFSFKGYRYRSPY